MERLRRSMMYVPGNKPGLIKDCMIYGADSIMFDLEDSIALTEKDSARILVYHALTYMDWSGVETVVRVNGLNTPFGKEDVKWIVKARPDVIRLPKTECAQDVQEMEKAVAYWEAQYGYPQRSIKLMAAVETAQGVLNALSIAQSSPRLMGIALGAEDYVTDLHTTRSASGIELFFGRCQVLNAARAAQIACFDTVYSDVDNDEGFRQEASLIHQLGFDGKSLIHPRQVSLLHEVYEPKAEDVQKAIRIIQAAEEARQKGSGVVSLNGKMVDKPIIERAQRTLRLAKATGRKEAM